MPTFRDVLNHKGKALFTIRPEATIREAVRSLVSHGVGSLLVTDEEGRIRGILTERDILRFVDGHCHRFSEARVSERMTPEVHTGAPEDDLDDVMDRMTVKRFRHLPVLEEGRPVAMISIGDVVNALRSAHEYENRQLKGYISGGYA